MMSPYWAHRDPHLFPSPESYNPVTMDTSTYQLKAFMCCRIAGDHVILIRANFLKDLLVLEGGVTSVLAGDWLKAEVIEHIM